MKRTPLLRRSRLPAMSPRRKIESALYSKQRLAFLAAHPFCQLYLAENNLSEEKAHDSNGWHRRRSGSVHTYTFIPRSTEIHHTHKRGRFYLDESTWMAVSREGHERIENNKSWARAKGYLK